MATEKKQMTELGALWKRKAKTSGESYLNGMIKLTALGIDKEVPVIIFQNKHKTQDNHPDLRVYLSEPREGGTTTTTTRAAKPAAKAAPAPADNDLI